jgi:hypothetical protein
MALAPCSAAALLSELLSFKVFSTNFPAALFSRITEAIFAQKL